MAEPAPAHHSGASPGCRQHCHGKGLILKGRLSLPTEHCSAASAKGLQASSHLQFGSDTGSPAGARRQQVALQVLTQSTCPADSPGSACRATRHRRSPAQERRGAGHLGP